MDMRRGRPYSEGMKEFQKIVRFMRFNFQGIAIASLGTMGLTPSWGAFIVGIGSMLFALVLLMYEKED